MIFDIVGNHFYKEVALSVGPHHLLGHAFENGHLQMLIWLEKHSLHEIFSNYITLYFPFNHLYIMDHFIAKGYQFRISQADLLAAIDRRDETTLDWIERNTNLNLGWSEAVFHCAWPRTHETVAGSFVIAWLQRNADRNEFLSNRRVKTVRRIGSQEPSMNVTWQGYIKKTVDLQKRNIEIWYHPPNKYSLYSRCIDSSLDEIIEDGLELNTILSWLLSRRYNHRIFHPLPQ